MEPYNPALQSRQSDPAHYAIAQEAVQARAQQGDTRPMEDLSKAERAQVLAQQQAREDLAATNAARTTAAATVMAQEQQPLAVPLPDGRPDLYHAACDGDVAALAAHRALGADLGAAGQPNPHFYNGTQFEKRWTFTAPPLVFAAAYGREEAVRALLAWGADPRQPSATGLTARDYAAKRGYTTIMNVLDEAESKAKPS